MNDIPENQHGLAASIFDGLDFGIRWIYETNTDWGRLQSRRLNLAYYSEAEELLSETQDYSNIFYIMSMLFNAHATARRANGGPIVVRLKRCSAFRLPVPAIRRKGAR